MILKVRNPDNRDAKSFAFFGGIKSVEIHHGTYKHWKNSTFDHWYVEGGSNEIKGGYCVLIVSATFESGHSENFIITTFAYLMSDTGKTIEKLYSV